MVICAFPPASWIHEFGGEDEYEAVWISSSGTRPPAPVRAFAYGNSGTGNVHRAFRKVSDEAILLLTCFHSAARSEAARSILPVRAARVIVVVISGPPWIVHTPDRVFSTVSDLVRGAGCPES
jgi:hypothetical protein